MRFVRVGLRLQFVCELPELVEIDARPEAEGMRNDLRRGAWSGLRRGAQAGADCAVYGYLEWDAKLPGALFQKPRQVVVERKSGPHTRIIDKPSLDVKASES